MPEQVVEFAKNLSGPLAVVCYGLALLFGLYKIVVPALHIPMDAAPPIMRAILRHGFIIVVLLVLGGFALTALSMLLSRS